MNLTADPWGQLYYFYPGPWRNPDGYSGNIPFRIYFPDLSVPGGPRGDSDTFPTWDPEENPGGADTTQQFNVGYAAPRDLTMYVWSSGGNLVVNQLGSLGYEEAVPSDDVGLDYKGGGDDITNWDNDQSWVGFYN
jgi:hypothetical protein